MSPSSVRHPVRRTWALTLVVGLLAGCAQETVVAPQSEVSSVDDPSKLINKGTSAASKKGDVGIR